MGRTAILLASLALLAVAGCAKGRAVSNAQAKNDAVDITLDMNPILPADRIEETKRRAIGGDGNAALALANHYYALDQTREQMRWLRLSANRGNCHSMALLMDDAENRRDREGRTHWNDMLRQHDCTWARAHRQGEPTNSAADLRPLWNDQ
jgi:hypothetical protein